MWKNFEEIIFYWFDSKTPSPPPKKNCFISFSLFNFLNFAPSLTKNRLLSLINYGDKNDFFIFHFLPAVSVVFAVKSAFSASFTLSSSLLLSRLVSLGKNNQIYFVYSLIKLPALVGIDPAESDDVKEFISALPLQHNLAFDAVLLPVNGLVKTSFKMKNLTPSDPSKEPKN